MLVVFVGPPGAGKGTQSKRLLSYLSAVHLSTGDILRAAIEDGSELGKMARSFMDQGQLVPCEIMIDLIADRLNSLPNGKNCLLDGFPRTMHQAEELDRMLEETGCQIHLVLALINDRDELQRRLLERAKQEGRTDDSPETIKRRVEIYEAQTLPLVDYYERKSLLQKIDGMGSPDAVFARIKKAVDTAAN